MIIKKVVKVELNEVEKSILKQRVEPLTEGWLCEGIDCGGIICSPDCPFYNLDEQVQALRLSVLNVIKGAE